MLCKTKAFAANLQKGRHTRSRLQPLDTLIVSPYLIPALCEVWTGLTCNQFCCAPIMKPGSFILPTRNVPSVTDSMCFRHRVLFHGFVFASKSHWLVRQHSVETMTYCSSTSRVHNFNSSNIWPQLFQASNDI